MLPPLRERDGDISLLIDHMLGEVNRESAGEPGYIDKNLSASAINIMLAYPWPGNARELFNTIHRAAVWSPDEIISAEDVREILPTAPIASALPSSGLSIADGTNLPEILADITREYLLLALKQTAGNKTKAAKLLGLPNYQTFTNWCEKHGITE